MSVNGALKIGPAKEGDVVQEITWSLTETSNSELLFHLRRVPHGTFILDQIEKELMTRLGGAKK